MADTSILVPATLPPTPLVLVDAKFTDELSKVEGQVSALSVKDADTAQKAAIILRTLTASGRTLEDAREQLKKPFLQVGRLIDETARKVSIRIASAKETVAKQLAEWNRIEEQRVAEERRRRDEELMRLQREKDEQDRIAAEKAKAAVASAPSIDLDFESLDFADDAAPAIKSEVDRKIEAIAVTPPPAVRKPSGVAFRKTLRWGVSDLTKLPEQFIVRSAHVELIRTTYCVGWKETDPVPTVPGLMFWVESGVASTGRAAS